MRHAYEVLRQQSSALDGGAQIPYREEDAEREDQHEGAEADDEYRLDLGRKRFQLVLDLALVHVPDLLEELVERAGLLPDRDHLQHDRGEDLRSGGTAQQGFPALDTFAHFEDLQRDV